MRIEPIQQPTFGILKGSKKTHYGDYMWGVFKDYKIEIFNAKKCNQKLQYVSNNKTLEWIKSKLVYFQNGAKKIVRSQNRYV